MTVCPACQSDQVKVFESHPQDHEYFKSLKEPSCLLRCLKCASLFQDPWPCAEDLVPLYDEKYQNYVQCSSAGVSRLFNRLTEGAADRFVSRFGKDVSVLDVGCGAGWFLEALAKKGVTRLTGQDVLAPRIDAAYTPVATLSELKGQQFDVIRLNHVIEHFSNHEEVMTCLAEQLSPQGCLMGQTPNAGHYTVNLWKTFWGGLHWPYHTLLFSPEGLRRAGASWGLQLTAVQSSVLPTGWSMSFENAFKALTHNKTVGRTKIYLLFLLLSAPFVVFDWLLSFCGVPAAIIDFEFRRQRTS